MDVMKDQALVADAYYNLTKIVRFQKVFDKFGDLNDFMKLATKYGLSVASGGEGEGKWEWISKFKLRNELYVDEDEYLMIVSTEEQQQLEDSSNQEPSYVGNIIFDDEKAKWSTWPSTLVDSLKRIMEVAKVNNQLKFDAFQATQPNKTLIPSPQIHPVDEGSPM